MSKARGNNRTIRGTGRDYGRGILGGQVFYRMSRHPMDFILQNLAELLSLQLRFLQMVKELLFSIACDCYSNPP
jgi:hypothetical protein